jgi:hypothetical protein
MNIIFWLLLLFPVCITLHNLEEVLFFSKYSTGEHSSLPVTHPRFIFAVIILTLACYLIAVFSYLKGPYSLWSYLFYGYAAAMTLNVFMPHLLASLRYRRYLPGLVSGLLLVLPAGLLVLFRFPRENYLSLNFPYILIPASVIVLMAASLPVLFKLGKILIPGD